MKPIVFRAAVAAALSTLLVSAAASAAGESKEDKGGAEKGGVKDLVPSGGAGPSDTGAGAGLGGEAARDESARGNKVRDASERKIWQVGISAEYHRLIIQNDLEGAAVNKNSMVYAAYVGVDPTPRDLIRLRGSITEHFLADPGETGVRSSDLILQYLRVQPLPYEITLRPSASITFPTSFNSQLASSVTSPAVAVVLDKPIGKWVHIDPRASATYYIVHYGTEGAIPNAQFRTALGFNAEAQMPFLPELSIGADATTAYSWYYKARAAQAGTNNPSFPGTVTDPTYTSQPVQQTYGFEAYARYDLSRYRPEKATDLRWDATLAFSNGDNVLHDGSQVVYWAFRTSAEVYGVVSARY